MKNRKIISRTIITTVSLTLIAGTAMAKKPFKKRHLKNEGKGGAIREELMLDRRDNHGVNADIGKDIRPLDINAYHKSTYTRILALLKVGKINEFQGTEYKSAHTSITASLATANKDGTLTSDEIKSIRGNLNTLNDKLTATAGEADADAERTPLLNKRQHHLEELVKTALNHDRISTLKANGIKRKIARLSSLEERLKSDKEISKREREKLFEEVNKIYREVKIKLSK